MNFRIKNFFLIVLLVPFFCGVIMMLGCMYPNFLEMHAFSFIYKGLLKYFQLTNGDSLINFIGYFITVTSFGGILFIQQKCINE